MRLILSLPALALANAAGAQTAPRPMLSAECRTEITTLCPRGNDRAARRQCIMTNRDKISEGCQSELKAMRAARGGRMGITGDMAAPGAMATEAAPQ